MLGKPESPIAPLLGVAREIYGAGDGGSWSFAGVHADEIKDGDRKRHRLLDVRGEESIHGNICTWLHAAVGGKQSLQF